MKETLLRLFGHDDDRSLLAKLAGRTPLKKHRLDPDKGSNVFKRSTACDNLIKNLLALDAVFNSQDLVCDLAEGQVSAVVLHQEIERARARLEQKLYAYGYWVDRLNSLEAVLSEQPSLEDFALEDRLSVDGQGSTAGKGTPYALRAVQLLERVEEQGRSSLLSPDQLTEKAWALYRLGLSDQAMAAAQQAVEADPEHSEAWMLLAIHCINEKRSADQEVARYEFQREEADPMSGQERWAEEMRDMAEDRRAKALTEHRAVVFPALLYWPRDHENPHRRYRYRENYEQIRNSCIDWLFVLTQPETRCLSTGVDWLRAAEAQGRISPCSWKENPQKHYDRWVGEAGSVRCLSDVETQVAMRICAEMDEWAAQYPNSSPDYYFFQQGWWKSNNHFTKLKLLHVRSVLGLPGYEAARQSFLTDLREVAGWDLLSVILHQPALFHALTWHAAASGLDELMSYFRGLVDAVAKEQQGKFSLLKGNLLRRAYHQAFARAEFSRCLSVAREAQTFLEQASGFAPPELGMDESQSNTLSLKHWKYLELRAAIEIAPESVEAQQALLSVAQPARYFADEGAYLIQEVMDIEFGEDCYVAPYGESILTSGQWLQAVEALLSAGVYADPETKSRARELMAQLTSLVEENSSGWSPDVYCKATD
ncbi:tetratricopeptide repeat protein [Metapseudomonas boanensis]|uniref:Tetratricopeptide repeat protein n=1 Tax=Metapseudomonas boanensis TaxID=2822138 RepID=A0ABS5XI47_9GAMM|nr:tetratricopeptide repeat protein [Pseudomonas boanensis]MBT8767325.1 hypothetical protein [Pseudomonas boanensis]